ncbi:MAG: Asp-tRNA(Asn)/Glu-tRNA(Gln) amidotransferase subunit GatA, partial [Nitrospirota bacterium]
MELFRLTIHELQELLKKGEIKSREIVESVYERIRKVDKDINAYVTLTEEMAFKKADDVDKRLSDRKDTGLLMGIPLGIKDNIVIEGIRTTCSSKMLENFIPPYNATVVSRLNKEDAVFIGKTNLDEFAMGSSTENSAFFTTKNPWNFNKIPGGSSGGSAAAASAGECIAALGSDTGGSIRQPAACCGVVGLKPTYGRVSRFGLVAFASSLDQIGPITKDVTDCAILLNCISGHDHYDSTSAEYDVPDFTQSLKRDVSDLKFGIPEEYFRERIDPEVERAVRDGIDILRAAGGKIIDISLPHTDYATAVYYILATAEASSNLARYDGVKYGHRAVDVRDLMDMYLRTREEGFGDEVKRRIMLGTYVLSSGYYDAYYKKAQQVRRLIKGDFDDAFKEVDIIITPTSPTPAFNIGEKTDNPLQMYLSDIFTISANLAPGRHAGG